MSGPRLRPGDAEPLLAGVVAAVVGFASSFAVVVTGLRSVGASEAQAASGLLALAVSMGVVSVALSLRLRLPVAVAWSTPGAALLASSPVPGGGFAAAVGAFMVTGVLLAVTGSWRRLARVLQAIPAPIASAMLAGVLLELCLAPVRAVAEVPAQALPVVATWAVLGQVARRWAVPGALVAAGVATAIGGIDLGGRSLAPGLEVTAPSLHLGALVGIALPLFVVTMASQNIPGIAVLAGNGYTAPVRPVLITTGVGTTLIGPLGGHAINFAAITAALVAGPQAGLDRSRRWVASVCWGSLTVLLGLGAGVATAVLSAAPPVLIEGVAGLALLPTLGSALASAAAAERDREAAVVTFVTAGSGITLLGVGAPFWGLLAGLGLLGLRRALGSEPPVDRPAGEGVQSAAGEVRETAGRGA